MNRKNLLYLNLSVDEKDVSLGFAKTWTDQFSKNFDNVDIITLNKPVENIEYQNVKIYGIAKGSGMIQPDMATTLAYIFTDADLPNYILKKLLKILILIKKEKF